YFVDEKGKLEFGPDLREFVTIHSHPPLATGSGDSVYILPGIVFSDLDQDTNIAFANEISDGQPGKFQAYIVPTFPPSPQNSDVVIRWLGREIANDELVH